MAGEWQETSLADVAVDVSYGYTESATTDQVGPKFLRITDIQGGVVDWSHVPYCPITPEEHRKYKLTPGDIVVARTGNSTGENYLYWGDEDAVFASYLIRFRLDRSRVSPRFVWYNMRTSRWWGFINSSKTGSAQAGANAKVLGRFPLTLPPLGQQDAIACILGALDDKIALNRMMNRTLEATARAIFKSWFVDFDPVRAKAAGRQPHGLKPEISALFPDSFEDSELGEIPRGWTITSLADQITANKGLSYKGQHLCQPGEGLPMHNLNSVYEGGGYKYEGLKWYNGEYRPAHLLKPGDVIVTNTEQGFDYLLIGYAAIVPERYGPQGLFSHHIFRIQQKATSYLPAWFTYLLFRTQHFHNVVAGHTNGTTVNMLPLDGLQKPKFALPPREIVGRFGHLFIPTQQRLEGIYDENVFLADLRDALLPRLISGELVVTEAERIAGRCA
ncbi:restriction endonuclease subunit S [Aminiphilus circumscriptus]|jgi:type I restriction enzyme S subunit|uniref:restriction endonuclease subunit S n=1 Tax=Aminiphilus circumscriptus TaxID=290732 RepID=UPI000492C775|nr:restriction endonuclease subunit S [Aminiphilus circumscriptus]